MFTYQTSVKLHQTDAAGLLYFAHQFTFAHDCFEAFLEKKELTFAKLIREADFLLPIVHAESDYARALFVGDKISVELTVDSIGTTSFGLNYRVLKGAEQSGTVRLVHVCLDKKSKQKRPIPEIVREILRSPR